MSNVSLNVNTTYFPKENSCSDYFALLKPRVMSLVVFTGFSGMCVAPGFSELHPLIAFTAILCLALGAGAAGGINMWYDRDIDAVMNRTKNRPIPAGRILPAEALSFSVILSFMAVITMGLAVNWMAAGLLAFASFFYSVVYTMLLKRSTPQNIVIGGAAGAFPPMIGWASVTGEISYDSVIMFLIIFLWTPPHFWALSLFAGKDYAAASIPMMNVVRGERSTKIQMILYTLILYPVTLLPVWTGLMGVGYMVIAGILGSLFILTAFKTYRDDSHKSAKLMFGYSVFYLFSVFLAFILLN
jgi:protoheme IX farnesyltransferase